MTCSNCNSETPRIRTDAAGIVVESCTDPSHADYAAGSDEAYRQTFRAKREAELAAAKRAPKTKAIADLYWELDAAEYDAALHAVGLER
jgi:hypothetical protein